MATLRDIRRRINAVNNTAKITQAQRMVSISKLKRAQDAIVSARPFAARLSDMLTNLVQAVGEDYSHPLLQKRKSVENIVIILIGADRGMCGSFNTNVFRFTQNLINETLPKEYPDARLHLIAVGKRAVISFKNPNVNVIKQYPAAFAPLDFATAKEIISIVSGMFIKGEADKVLISFNMFKNLLVQVPTTITLLPIEQKQSANPIQQKKGSEETKLVQDAQHKSNAESYYIFEPDQKSILDELLPRHLDIQMWRTLLESNAAEHASRMIAMENATKNANDLVKYLNLVFNKERQAAITKEMLEIVGGANALGNK